MAKKRGDYLPRATPAQKAQRERRKAEAFRRGVIAERERIVEHVRVLIAAYESIANPTAARALRELAARAGLVLK